MWLTLCHIENPDVECKIAKIDGARCVIDSHCLFLADWWFGLR